MAIQYTVKSNDQKHLDQNAISVLLSKNESNTLVYLKTLGLKTLFGKQGKSWQFSLIEKSSFFLSGVVCHALSSARLIDFLVDYRPLSHFCGGLLRQIVGTVRYSFQQLNDVVGHILAYLHLGGLVAKQEHNHENVLSHLSTSYVYLQQVVLGYRGIYHFSISILSHKNNNKTLRFFLDSLVSRMVGHNLNKFSLA